MAVIRCPNCNKPNPDFLEACQYCDHPLKAGASAAPAMPTPEPPRSGDAPKVIRCPNCNKPNAATADYCQYCDTPLQPGLQPKATSATDWLESGGEAAGAEAMPDWLSGMAGAAQPADDTPDWLKSAGGGAAGDGGDEWLSQSVRSAAPVVEEVPDWMKSIQGEAPAAQADDVPDWLKSMQGEAEPAPVAPAFSFDEPAATPTDDMPDWMKSIQGEAPAASAPTAPSFSFDEPAAAPAEDVPDWMKGMGTQAAEPTPAVPSFSFNEPAAAPAEDVPDWMKGMGTQAAEPTPAAPSFSFDEPAAPAEDMPDWMKGMGTQVAEPASAAPSFSFDEPAALADDVPDWLKGMGATSPAAAEPVLDTPSTDAPDWLANIPLSEAEPPAPPTHATGTLPSWMQQLGDTGPLPEIAPPPPLPSQTAPLPELSADAPDWLKAMHQTAATGPLPAIPETSAEQPAGDVPDWLAGMSIPATSTPAVVSDWETPSESTPAATTETPDWLSGMGGETTAPATPPPGPAEEQPDWLKAMGVSETSDITPTPAQPAASNEPDWLQGLRPSEEPTTSPSEDPDWLSNFRQTAGVNDEDSGGISPFTTTDFDTLATETSEEATLPGETPDWLAALRPAESAPDEGGEQAPADELSQVALPSWLASMRPVDAGRAIAPEQDDYEEKIGILSGMRGVLQAEPLVVLPRKTAEQIHNVIITDDQRKQAKLLSQQLAADTAEAVAPKIKKKLAIPWERWSVALVLLLAVIVPLWMLPGSFQTPISLGRSVDQVFNLVENLPTDKPALVVFEYEPLYSGELNAAAETIVAHMLRRHVPIVTVSTLPTGAAQADLVLHDAANNPTDFPVPRQPTTDYLNLGYIPGGAVGLLEFVQTPRLVFTTDFSGTADFDRTLSETQGLWTLSFLTNVQTLNDFSLVVLVASDPTAVRNWMEQTQSWKSHTEALTGTVPLVAAVSASAEPIVRPYLESGQLSGLVGGIIEAGQYEQRMTRPHGSALRRWDGISGGLYASILLVMIGGLIYGVRGMRRK